MPLNSNNQLNNQEETAYLNAPEIYHRETIAVPAPERGIGIDTHKKVFDNIVEAGVAGKLDISSLESFSRISQSRDSVYNMLDTMCNDSTIAAVLETYAEDATEYNDQGQIVWAESSDSNVQKYVQFLLDTMNVDKHIYKWVYSLCKYGDIYLRMYRESDYHNDNLFGINNTSSDKKQLNEDVRIKAYSENDHYVNYLEMAPNPAEIFELTKLGKTYAYIKADVNSSSVSSSNMSSAFSQQLLMQYNFKKSDIDLHAATDYVHACLEDNTSRTPEQVQIFLGSGDEDADEALTYSVKRGQSLLYNTFKVWRELQLLENSVLLNRITKSSIVRIISVEVGNMSKEMVGPHLQGIKSLIEQKSALNTGNSMSEYTNPGPIENNIYVPTHEGIGAITTSQVGGDVDVKSLADLEYYRDRLFGALRVPKQYFGWTDDGAGFSGGQSLSIISARYGKMVKRIQNTIIQAITDAINLLLLDRDLKNYVNKFTIHMLPPTTQEELDRRENLTSKVGLTSDIMNMLGDIETTETKLKILKSLLSNILTDGEAIALIQEEIDRLEKEKEDSSKIEKEDTSNEDLGGEDLMDFDLDSDTDSMGSETSMDNFDLTGDFSSESGEESIEPIDSSNNDSLPTPEELGVDMTQNL